MSLIIKAHIDQVLCFLEPFLPLANCHMVDYFSQSALETYISNEIREEIANIGAKPIVNNIFDNHLNETPHLQNYISNCKKFNLNQSNDICLNLNQLQAKFNNNLECLKLDVFMTSKKSHEVEILSAVSAAIQSLTKTTHLIDIGDGKGYLSSMLAMHYKIPVLGVDASLTNTNGAVKRVEKLSRVWNSLVTKDEKSKSRETSANLYKQVTQFVDENVDFQRLIAEVFMEEPGELGIIGLHTCGNLAANSLRIFHSSEAIRTICNVGCCYHFLTEEFETKFPSEGNYGFPLSEHLRNKKFVVGRPARMIAAQSVDRILNEKQMPNITIFYRAVFEVLLKQYAVNVPSTKVGRFRKGCIDFVDYVRKSLKRLNIDLDLSDAEINKVLMPFEDRLDELNAFYLIRCKLAPVLESLILLDRLLFLHECGYPNSFLVQLFDPIVSPRCYGIVAIK